MLAFCFKLCYIKQVVKIRFVGQAAKTSPSHGENRGSIPLRTAIKVLGNQGFFLFAVT